MPGVRKRYVNNYNFQISDGHWGRVGIRVFRGTLGMSRTPPLKHPGLSGIPGYQISEHLGMSGMPRHHSSNYPGMSGIAGMPQHVCNTREFYTSSQQRIPQACQVMFEIPGRVGYFRVSHHEIPGHDGSVGYATSQHPIMSGKRSYTSHPETLGCVEYAGSSCLQISGYVD